jgi:putative chitinase
MTLKLEKLKGQVPDSVLKQIPMASEKFGINTPLRLAHFLSQCSHESGGFKTVNENLNYSAQGLANTWPNRFAVDSKKKPLVPNQLALEIERKPQLIANNVYSDRMGNGSPQSNDGFNFRGRGYIQLTGKSNYLEFGRLLNEDITSKPEKVSTDYPLLSAAWFFNKNGINKLCDLGSTDDVVKQVTKKINGGTNGLADRIKYFKKFHELLK